MASKLFVFGDLCVDIVAVPQSIPSEGSDTSLEQLELIGGGAAYNCAISAAMAGATVEAIGITGVDEFGRMIVESLVRHGVGVRLVQARADARTGAVVSIAGRGGERTLYSYRGVNSERYGDVPGMLLESGDCVYLSGYSLQKAASGETAHRLRTLAARAGAICLLDPSFQWASSAASGQRDFLEGLDWITPNAKEAELLTGTADVERAAAELRAIGVSNVVITLGAAGCFIENSRVRVRLPAEGSGVVRQTTGAGDAFCGGLLAALLEGCDAVEAGRRANRAAANAITQRNGRLSG